MFQKIFERARRYYERATEQNNSMALSNLGDLYYWGRGVQQDYVRARRYYERAAEQNNTEALNNLGVLYNNGRGSNSVGISGGFRF